MKMLQGIVLVFILLGTALGAAAQDLKQVEAVWQQALDALHHEDVQGAKALSASFNQQVRAYVQAYGRNWQIEYLAGALNCQFPESRASGVRLLNDVLQNNRALNDAGEQELKHLIDACKGPAPSAAPSSYDRPELLRQIADASAHFQTPGVHADMKGGGGDFRDAYSESAAPSPIPVEQLLGRRVPRSQPQKALSSALALLNEPGAKGGVVEEFAVVAVNDDSSYPMRIGNCLQRYMPPLKNEFQIQPDAYMVTVYAADSPLQVYEFAGRLHGLELPRAVVAYSVPEDMSLTAVGYPDACGSMAHEIVHLFSKRSLPVSPAWLEEGLASEVAVASVGPDRYTFSWSWRDDVLNKDFSMRPSVAELLDKSWTAFTPQDASDVRRAASVQAMAAVFIRYLDHKGVLSDVYAAVRDQHFSPDLTQYKSYPEIIEAKLGMNIDKIDADFGEWFQSEKSANLGKAANGSPSPTRIAVPCGIANMPAQQASPCEVGIMNEAPQPMNQAAPSSQKGPTK